MDLCHEPLAGEEGLLDASKLRDPVRAGIAEGNEVEVIDDEALALLQGVTVDSPEGIDEDRPLACRPDHEEALAEETLCEPLPLHVEVDRSHGCKVGRLLEDETPSRADCNRLDVTEGCCGECGLAC